METQQKKHPTTSGTPRKKPKSLSFAPISADLEIEENDQRAPNYLALYGLRESAFSQELDDRFFFSGDLQIKYLSFLHNLIQHPNLLLHISGESGVGKTSLINRFINIGEEDWRFSFFTANAMMNVEQLFYNISAGFGLSAITNSNNDLKKKCIKNIGLLASSGVVPVLIIDDVQELPIESLKSIYQMLSGWDKNHPRLRVILISNSQFSRILGTDDVKKLQNLISHKLIIKPLVEEQIERYIYFRLTTAGLDGGNPVTPRACSFILEKSKGLPREINRLCHVALRDGMDEMTMKDFFDDHNFNFPYRKYLITGALIAIFLSVLFSFVDPYGEPENLIFSLNNEENLSGHESNTAISSSSILGHLSDEKIKPLEKNKPLAEIKPLNTTLDDSAANQHEFTKLFDFSQITMNLTNELIDANSTVIFNLIKSDYEKRQKINLPKKTNIKIKAKIKAKAKVSTVKNLNTGTNKQYASILSLRPNIILANSPIIKVSLLGKNFTNTSKVTIFTMSGSRVINENNINLVSNSQIDIEVDPKFYPGNNWISISNTNSRYGNSNKLLLEVKTAVQANGIASDKNGMKEFQWILAQKSDAFILQILGSKEKEQLVKFMYKKKVEGQYAVFETNRNGVKWYHLILGPYQDKITAKLAVQKLPRQVNTPWIRPIKDIQKLIKRQKNSL